MADAGRLIRAYRKASGLSQKDLARMGGVSRATLNYLESGREEVEVGAGKLFALMAALGITLNLPAGVERPADDAILEAAVKQHGGRGKARLTVPLLLEALASGAVPPGADAGLKSFLDTAPAAEVIVAVRTASARSGNPPKEVWGKARSLGKALHCEKGPWHPGS